MTIWMAEERTLVVPEGQDASVRRAWTEAAPGSELFRICTVGPGRIGVAMFSRPASWNRARLLRNERKPGEHCSPEKLAMSEKAVPETLSVAGWPLAEAKFQNLATLTSPGRPVSAEGPAGGTLGSAMQLAHSETMMAPA